LYEKPSAVGDGVITFDFLRNVFATPRTDEADYQAFLRRRDFVSALPLLQAAIRKDDGYAMAIFGTLLMYGRGVEANDQDAADWFRQSAVRGVLIGQTAYGACLVSGTGVARNTREAAHWLYKAAREGYPSAIIALDQVVTLHPDVVGEHFSLGDFSQMMTSAGRPVRVKVA